MLLVREGSAPLLACAQVVGVVSKGVIPKDASAPFSLAASTSTLSSTRALATLSRAWLDHTSGVHTGYGVQTASGRAGACWRRRGLPAGTWRRLLSAAANKRRQKGVTPVVAEALALGIPRENILCPEKAKDVSHDTGHTHTHTHTHICQQIPFGCRKQFFHEPVCILTV